MYNRSFGVESDGQLFKMQQEAARRAYEERNRRPVSERVSPAPPPRAQASPRSAYEPPPRDTRDVRREERRDFDDRRGREERRDWEGRRDRNDRHDFDGRRDRDERRDRDDRRDLCDDRDRRGGGLLGRLLGGRGGGLGGLFKDGKILGRFKTEDLLLIGLILLLLNEGADDDLILILGLLFIMGT